MQKMKYFFNFLSEARVSKAAEKADYQKQTTNATESQFNMIKKLEIDLSTHKDLINYSQ